MVVLAERVPSSLASARPQCDTVELWAVRRASSGRQYMYPAGSRSDPSTASHPLQCQRQSPRNNPVDFYFDTMSNPIAWNIAIAAEYCVAFVPLSVLALVSLALVRRRKDELRAPFLWLKLAIPLYVL